MSIEKQEALSQWKSTGGFPKAEEVDGTSKKWLDTITAT
jgi:hypothetical protein